MNDDNDEVDKEKDDDDDEEVADVYDIMFAISLLFCSGIGVFRNDCCLKVHTNQTKAYS